MLPLAATAAAPTLCGVGDADRGRESRASRVDGYRIGRLLGRGRTASVYLAQDRQGRRVALKLLERPQGGAAAAAHRFAAECVLLSSVRDRHVVRVHEHCASGALPFLSMEYVACGTLRERLRAGVQPLQALRLLAQTASGVAAAHGAGVVHRDVKPENFLVRSDGTLVLIDFGLAVRAGTADENAGDGRMVGTPRYAAPEQFERRACAPAADVYSLGVLFYEMLCGQPPFVGTTPLEMVAQHLVAPVPRLRGALAAYQPLVDRLLAKRPQQRPQDASALLHEIEGMAPREGACIA